MIPKIIHYCWFGRSPLPESAKKCISSWRKFFPDYEIKEWNEDNFNVNIIPYTQQAYNAKKYAFVSDYARFWILYHFGGIYFDTDVEVIKSFKSILEKGAFMGLEKDGTSKDQNIAIAPGLGLGAESKLDIYKVILEKFQQMDFYDANGHINTYTMIPMVTELFLKSGLKRNNSIQYLNNVYIYPSSYFNPYNYLTGKLRLTPETLSIHWYSATWLKKEPYLIKKTKQIIRRTLNFLHFSI